ncbi:MAG: hypothetical protein IT338_17315 [Thermomicrobiales bacterium]|nr:hypothetical protein [Thermomicrobiales bacterium]
MTRALDVLPEAARRAMALRASMELLGVDLERVILALSSSETPDHARIVVAYCATEGDLTSARYVAVCGDVPVTWSIDEIPRAWNALTQPQRGLERQRWVSPDALTLLVLDLHRAGVPMPRLPPGLTPPPPN